MIIKPSKSRLIILIISILAFLILTISTFLGASLLTLIDSAEQNFLDSMAPASLSALTKPFVLFSHGLLFALVIFVLAFLLWGFKFKIPAAWIVLTTISGSLLINIFSLIFPHRLAGQATQFPAHTIFFVTLLYFFLSKIVVPELKSFPRQIAGQIIILTGWILTFIGTILSTNYTFSDAVAGCLLAIAWLQLAAQFYGNYAPRAYRMNGFSNSWF